MSQFPYQPQPAWIDGSTVETQTRVRAFVRSVYGWMFGGLLLTALAAMWVVSSPAMQKVIFENRAVPWILFLGELGIVAFLSMRLTKMSAAAAAGAFLVFSLLNGLSLSVIFFLYTATSIAQTFVAAAGMFGAMALYGAMTKRDLRSWGSFFFMGLIGIIIASFLNYFFHSTALGGAINVLGVFIFLGLTAYDQQKLRSLALAAGPTENYAVMGALALYLDFINLFLFLLRLFGSRRN
jgi:uncharacterized protein